MLSMQAVPPTTEKVMDVFVSCDSADFILIDFRLLDYLWQSRHKFLHWWIENLRQHNHFNHPSGNKLGSLSIPILSGVIW